MTETSSFSYPQPRRDLGVEDDYHGTKVLDPYKWMEDPDCQETKDFVKEQNAVSTPYINSCQERETIKKELTDLWNFEKFGCPHKEGDRYFYSKNSGLQNQSVVYVQDSLEAEPRVLIDPNSFSEDGTVSLSSSSWSYDGSILAYGTSKSGSDWISIKFLNVDTGKEYEEELEKVKFSGITWTHDNKGVFYGCYPDHDASHVTGKDTTSHENQKLFYHRIGTKQSEDVLCVEFPEHPKWMIGSTISDCGRYLFVMPSQDCKYNLLYFTDLEKEAGQEGIRTKFSLTEIVTKFEADYDYVTNQGSKVIFHTNKGAENYRLVTIDLESPTESNWTDLVPENDDVLEWATGVAGDKLVTCYMHHVKNTLQLRELNSGKELHCFPLDIGSVTGFSGDIRHKEMFFKFSSQITPGTIYHVDMGGSVPEVKVHLETKVHGFSSSDYKVEQVFYPSKDGTKIPMFITMRKDFVPDASSPCLLYGYGGFSISLTPYYSTVHNFFVQHFGIMAIANMRGGGEYGERWSNGGRQGKLQNCLTDFQCAAEFLIKEKYTAREKLTIYGGSHGGMLVGACANQRPELYGAVVSAVGVMDMLRFHKFTVGYAWVSNYGCSDVKEEFPNLMGISPLHNIRKSDQQHPATLIMTGDHDDRVVPSHSLKYIATLQHTLGQDKDQTNPLLVRVDVKSGHGAGKPTTKSIEEYTDIFCFLVKSLGLQYKK